MSTDIRDGGKPRDVLQGIHEGIGTSEVSVPCNGCTACCRSPHVTVKLTHDEARQLRSRVHNEAVVLEKKENGECVYMNDDGRCSIYDIRPQTCRLYDCRIWGLVGILPNDDKNLRVRIDSWVFDLSDKDDVELVATLKNAATAAYRPSGQTVGDILISASSLMNYRHQ